MIRSALVLGLAAAAVSLGAAAQETAATATAELVNSAGQAVGGATLTQGPAGVLVRIEAKGMSPGWHGLHFHEVGDCSKSDFTSAGGHVHAQASRVHGLLNPQNNEAGDLPNIHVDSQGTAAGEFYTTAVSLRGAGGKPALLDQDGSAIVIHANPDDQTSQPIGGAGARVACGVVKVSAGS